MRDCLVNFSPILHILRFCETDSTYNLYFPFSKSNSPRAVTESFPHRRIRVLFVLSDGHSVSVQFSPLPDCLLWIPYISSPDIKILYFCAYDTFQSSQLCWWNEPPANQRCISVCYLCPYRSTAFFIDPGLPVCGTRANGVCCNFVLQWWSLWDYYIQEGWVLQKWWSFSTVLYFRLITKIALMFLQIIMSPRRKENICQGFRSLRQSTCRRSFLVHLATGWR